MCGMGLIGQVKASSRQGATLYSLAVSPSQLDNGSGSSPRRNVVFSRCLRAVLRSVPLLIVLAALTILSGAALAQEEEGLEERAVALDKQLICPVCPGESIHESRATLAKQMRAIVRERLAAGQSEQEILDYFVSVYDKGVLAEPPKEGFTLAIWVVPPLALALGVAAAVVALRTMRRRQAVSTGPASADAAPKELEGYLRMVDEERGGTGDPR